MAINLSKKQTINLSKENKSALTGVSMGLGWDTGSKTEKKEGGFFSKLFSSPEPVQAIDLDASCVIFGEQGVLGAVFFNALKSPDGHIQHSGDNRTGAGDGDDETIRIQFDKLNPEYKHLVFTVNNFTGQRFDKVRNAYCRVVNDKGVEVARYTLGDDANGNHTGLILMKISRGADGDWHCTAIGQPCDGRTWRDMAPTISALL